MGDSTRQSKTFVDGETVSFSATTPAAVWDEVWPLMRLHHAEVGVLSKDDFAPDRSKLDAMDRAGMVRAFTLRIGARLVGYALFLVMSHWHYPGTKWAMQDAMYVLPEHRGLRAIAFMADQDEFLQNDGVDVIVRSVQAKNDYSRTLTRLGYTAMERSYVYDLRQGRV